MKLILELKPKSGLIAQLLVVYNSPKNASLVGIPTPGCLTSLICHFQAMARRADSIAFSGLSSLCSLVHIGGFV